MAYKDKEKQSEYQLKRINERASSLSNNELAKFYKVHKTTISDIRLYKTWKNI